MLMTSDSHPHSLPLPLLFILIFIFANTYRLRTLPFVLQDRIWVSGKDQHLSLIFIALLRRYNSPQLVQMYLFTDTNPRICELNLAI